MCVCVCVFAQNIGLFKERAVLWLHEKELVSHSKRPRFVQTADEEDSWQSVCSELEPARGKESLSSGPSSKGEV